jgi:two-component system sensor histidine kinase PilS (NtrC family)
MAETGKKIVLQLIIFSLLIVKVLVGTSTFLPLSHFYLIVIFIYVLSCVYFMFYHWGRNYSFQVYFQIIMDLFWITALVYISGGLHGTFHFLYILEIVAASVLLSGRAAYLTAALSSIFFGALVDLMYFGVIPYYGGLHRSEAAAGVFINNIFVSWSVFFLIAFLVNSLTRRLRMTRSELEAARKELKVNKNLALAGDVAAHLAHEIRNPLAAISGSVQVLNRDLDLTGEQKELMRIVIKESERVSKSFEHFLTLASSGKMNFTLFRFSRLMKETLTLLKASGGLPDNIEIRGNYKSSDISYYGNSNQFKQIFWNILNNSVKAMPEGGLLSVNFDIIDKHSVLLRFTDTGFGMKEEDRERIFEPFFSGFEKGQGVGLSVVRRMVGDYNGHIDVVSAPEKGTEISIILPGQKRKSMNKDL